jgi:CBS domain-containing protein
MICPDCRHDNIAGVDHCDHCGQSLSQMDVPRAKSGLQRAIMETPLGDLQPAQALTASPGDPVSKVIGQMRDSRQGSVLILDHGRLVGIFTERDVVNRLTGGRKDLDHLPVSEVMTRNPKALREDDTLAFAMHRMAVGHYRHVPILTDGQAPRFVSVRGVLKYLHERALRG